MGRYTIEVRHICEAEAGLTEIAGYSSVSAVINSAIPKIFNFDFPIYDESYRNVLCTKILKHYYMREIGAETVGQWKLWLDARLNEIMPYYNQLYKSAMIEFNPMYDVDLRTVHQGKNGGSTHKEGGGTDTTAHGHVISDTAHHEKTVTSDVQDSGEDKNAVDTMVTDDGTTTLGTEQKVVSSKKDAFSDTPQGTLENVEANTYLTNYRNINDNDTTTNSGSDTSHLDRVTDYDATTTYGKKTHTDNKDIVDGGNTRTNSGQDVTTRSNSETTTINTTDDYITTIVGKNGSGSYSKMLLDFRKTFLNIDKMIIDDLNDLFFGLW